jgi:hypothetical protein
MKKTRRHRSARGRSAAAAAVALAATLAAAATAGAGVLASPFIDSASTGGVFCRISNVGKAPVELTAAKILSSQGADVTDTNGCETTLGPGDTCSIFAQGPFGGRGVVEVAGSAKRLRGACQLVDDGFDVVGIVEMR